MMRHQVKTSVINSRAEYYTKLIRDNQDDPARFWQGIKQLIPDCKEDSIDIHKLTDPQTRTPLVRELFLDSDIPVSIVLEYLADFKVTKPSGCPRISSKLY